jgi:hypothetical protein
MIMAVEVPELDPDTPQQYFFALFTEKLASEGEG